MTVPKKKVFYEPQAAGEVEMVLKEYAEAIRAPRSVVSSGWARAK